MKRKIVIGLIPLLLAGVIYFLNGPYLFPTTTALGPCMKDWTSPSSYTARSSPLETLDFRVGEVSARLCYGSPASRGRRLFGESGVVPFGRLWRMGANEPTRLMIDGPVRLGSLTLDPGRYSLYAQPDATEWQVFVSESTWHWGNMISSDVREREVGTISVPAIRRGAHEENLRFVMEDGALTMMWGFTRVAIPVAPAG